MPSPAPVTFVFIFPKVDDQQTDWVGRLIPVLMDFTIGEDRVFDLLVSAKDFVEPPPWRFTTGAIGRFDRQLSRPSSKQVILWNAAIPPIYVGRTGLVAQLQDFLRDRLAQAVEVGLDLPLFSTDREHWCPVEGPGDLFGKASTALSLVGAEALDGHDLRGRGVNVAIIDQGLNASVLGDNFAGGWTDGSHWPGTAPADGHGTMIARNVLRLAPAANIFDVPLIAPAPPGLAPTINDLPGFLHRAYMAYLQMLLDIEGLLRLINIFAGPWVFVNAWAVFDSRVDLDGSYVNNPLNFFSAQVAATVAADIDVLFSAGNCGAFCPDRRCGPDDTGPERSVFGVNALEQVMTVGAVRSDTVWLGYSSQGRGPSQLGRCKPDLCAPSQFSEDFDAFSGNTGTSAATGVAGGIVAALRERWASGVLSPAALINLLNGTARKTEGPGWNDRLGNGIIDAAAVLRTKA